jgi:hypothetical protein
MTYCFYWVIWDGSWCKDSVGGQRCFISKVLTSCAFIYLLSFLFPGNLKTYLHNLLNSLCIWLYFWFFLVPWLSFITRLYWLKFQNLFWCWDRLGTECAEEILLARWDLADICRRSHQLYGDGAEAFQAEKAAWMKIGRQTTARLPEGNAKD